MLVNIWSTPRTGSNWLSFFLRNQLLSRYKNVVFLSEPFNFYHHKMYYELKSNGELINHNSYAEGLFWLDYKLDTKNNIIAEKKYEINTLDWSSTVQNRKYLILNKNNENIVVMHNHVSPLDEDIFSLLSSNATHNYYTYRVEKRNQLASYALAYHTKNFIKFGGNTNETQYSNIVNPEVLEDFCCRISESEKRMQTVSKHLRIAYEDMSFVDFPNSPIKQFKNSWEQLQTQDKKIIDDLILKYRLAA